MIQFLVPLPFISWTIIEILIRKLFQTFKFLHTLFEIFFSIGKVNELGDEVKRLQYSLKSCTSNAEEHENKLKENLEQLNKKLKRAEDDLETSKLEEDKLNKLCQQHSQWVLNFYAVLI